MFGLRGIPAKKLVALKFADPPTFRRAARRAAEKKIRVDAPGRSTLIVRGSDKHLLEEGGLKFRAWKIADPEEVDSKTLSRLRFASFRV
jgi:hypothetical protein